MTLLELFLSTQGGQKVKELISNETVFAENPTQLWGKALVPYIITTSQLLYPPTAYKLDADCRARKNVNLLTQRIC